MRSSRRVLALAPVLAAPALVLAVALASPAVAAPRAPLTVTDPVTQDPIAEEPPGGAVCNPDLPAEGCEQEGGYDTPAPVAPTTPRQPSSSAGSGAQPGRSSQGSSPSVTPAGARPAQPASLPASLARTGPEDALPFAMAGVAALAAGLVLVVAGRPRRDAEI